MITKRTAGVYFDGKVGDVLWLMVCGFLVFFMQCGFALLEAGTVRAKNTKNILMKNLLDACVGALIWWSIGYYVAVRARPNRTPIASPLPLPSLLRARNNFAVLPSTSLSWGHDCRGSSCIADPRESRSPSLPLPFPPRIRSTRRAPASLAAPRTRTRTSFS